jgi:hypothetical protein
MFGDLESTKNPEFPEGPFGHALEGVGKASDGVEGAREAGFDSRREFVPDSSRRSLVKGGYKTENSEPGEIGGIRIDFDSEQFGDDGG